MLSFKVLDQFHVFFQFVDSFIQIHILIHGIKFVTKNIKSFFFLN